MTWETVSPPQYTKWVWKGTCGYCFAVLQTDNLKDVTFNDHLGPIATCPHCKRMFTPTREPLE